MGQFQLFPLIFLLVISFRHIVGTPTPNLTCYFGPNQNVDDLDPFLCTKVVANAIQTITQEGNEPRIDINSPRLAKLVALKIVNPELQLILGIDAPNTQALLQNTSPDALVKSASQFGRLLTAVLMDGIDFEYDPPAAQNATQDLTRLFSTFQPIFAPLTVSLTVQDSFGPTPALSKLNIDHVHVLPSAKPSLTPEREDRQILAKMEPWLKTGFQGSQLSVGLKIGGVSWRQDAPQGPYVIAVERVSRPKICRTLQMPDWQSTVDLTNPDVVLAVAQSADGRQKFIYPSEKKISKVIQKVAATVGGVAVMDLDLDDPQNECGKGPWGFTKLVRDALKLPPLKEQGGVTRIRLKLNLGTLQNVGVFRWLNDDTEAPLKRTRRDSWSRRQKNHDDSSDNRPLRWFNSRHSAKDNEEDDSFKSFPRSRRGRKGKRKSKKPRKWHEWQDVPELADLPELRSLDGPAPETEQSNGDQRVTTPNITTTTELPPLSFGLHQVVEGGETSTTSTTKVPDVMTTTLQSTTLAAITTSTSNPQINETVSKGADTNTDNQGTRAKRQDKVVWPMKKLPDNKFNDHHVRSLPVQAPRAEQPKKDLLTVPGPSPSADSRTRRPKRESDLWPKQNRNSDRFNDNRQPRWYPPHGSKRSKLEVESYKATRHARKGRRGGRQFQNQNSGEMELRSLLGATIAEPEVPRTVDNIVETTTSTAAESPALLEVPEVPIPPPPPVPVEPPTAAPLPIPIPLPDLIEIPVPPVLPSLSENGEDPVPITTEASPKTEGVQDKPGNDPNIKLRVFEELPSKRGAKRFNSKPGPQDFNTKPFRRQSRFRRSTSFEDSPDLTFGEPSPGNGDETQGDPSNMSYYLTLVSEPQARTSATRNNRAKRQVPPSNSTAQSKRQRGGHTGKVRHPGLNALQVGNQAGQVDVVLQSVITTTIRPPETTPDAGPKEVKLRGKVIKLRGSPDSSEAQLRCGGRYPGYVRRPPVAWPRFYGTRAGYQRYKRSPTVTAPAVGVVRNTNIVVITSNPPNTKNGRGEQKPGQAKHAPGQQGIHPRNKKQQAQAAKQGAAASGKPELRHKNGNRQASFRPGIGHLRRRRIGKKRSKDPRAVQQTTVKSNPATTPIPPAPGVTTAGVPKAVQLPATTPATTPGSTPARPSLRNRVKREIKKVPDPVTIFITPRNNLNKLPGLNQAPLAVPVVKPVGTQRVVPMKRPRRDLYFTHDPEETDINEDIAPPHEVVDTGYQAFPEQEFPPEDQGEPLETYYPPEDQDEALETYFPPEDQDEAQETYFPPEHQDEAQETYFPPEHQDEAQGTDWLQEEDLNDPGLNWGEHLEADGYAPGWSRKTVSSFESVELRTGTKINREAIREKIKQQLQAAAAAAKRVPTVKKPKPVLNRATSTVAKLTAVKKPLRLPIRTTTTKEPPLLGVMPPQADQTTTTTTTTEPPTTTTEATTSSPTTGLPLETGQSRRVNRFGKSPSLSNFLSLNRNRNRKAGIRL